MSKEQFDLKKNEIESIDESQVNYPDIPVNVVLQESENLMVWCQDDKEQLEKGGLDWNLVTDLTLRTGACRYIQSEWQKEYKGMLEVQKEWKVKSPEAYNLRNELLHHFYYAFKKMPDLYAQTQSIGKGSSHADMIQDLSDLAILGKANSSALLAVGVDLELLNRAETLSEEMSILLAKFNAKKLENSKLRLLRDKAYIHMKVAMDEIRRCGQYVFWRNKERRKGYISQYLKKKNKRAKEKTEKTKKE